MNYNGDDGDDGYDGGDGDDGYDQSLAESPGTYECWIDQHNIAAVVIPLKVTQLW